MSLQGNRALVQRLVEQVWNQRNIAAIDELCTPECVTKEATGLPFMGGTSRALWKEITPAWFKAVPDISVTIEDMVAEGDRVVSRWVVRGTHLGDYIWGPHPPYKPTGKKVAVACIYIHRISGGKIVEEWFAADFTDYWRQFGALPT
jgi:predicted ester cyclase